VGVNITWEWPLEKRHAWYGNKDYRHTSQPTGSRARPRGRVYTPSPCGRRAGRGAAAGAAGSGCPAPGRPRGPGQMGADPSAWGEAVLLQQQEEMAE